MPDNVPDLSIPADKLCFIIAKAREFDVKDVVTDPDDASNPTDDAMIAVLEDHRDDPVVQELVAVIRAMSEDEQIDLVTLTWLGRGDGGIEDWGELRAVRHFVRLDSRVIPGRGRRPRARNPYTQSWIADHLAAYRL
jgi:uncharacterized protein DUF3775